MNLLKSTWDYEGDWLAGDGGVGDGGCQTYDRGHTHGRTGVARVGLEGGVHLRMLSVCVLAVMEELWCRAWKQDSRLNPSIGVFSTNVPQECGWC